MNPVAAGFFAVAALALLLVPRRFGAVPIIIAACYMPRIGVSFGPFTFYVLRLLVVVGVVRVAVRREGLAAGLNSVDRWMIAWGLWLVASVFFHKDPSRQLVTRLGNVFDAWGLYFLFRTFLRSLDEIVGVLRVAGVALVPVALEMLAEKALVYNFFSMLGGVPSTPVVRGGKARSQGPFDVSILAGTVGAIFLPHLLGIWSKNRLTTTIGLVAALAMIYASTSSGPILTAAWGIGALCVWRYRDKMRLARWGAVAMYLFLMVVMKDPPYFLMAKIDLTGTSTGWHRSEIIRAAINHLSEWWLVGTDRTIHWMPYGIAWSPDHTDITNQYLEMGVLGGLPLMFLYIGVVVKAFSSVGIAFRSHRSSSRFSEFIVWSVGATLFAHAVTFLSMSYYDQSMVFLYLTLGMTGCIKCVEAVSTNVREGAVAPQPLGAGPSWQGPGSRGRRPATTSPWAPVTSTAQPAAKTPRAGRNAAEPAHYDVRRISAR